MQIGFEDAASASGLRKASERIGTIRIITIEDLDRSACGGTHVRATGEIGCILLRRLERIRKGVRLEFLCGLRAVRRSRTESEVLGRLTAEYSASLSELPQLAASQRAELKQAGSVRRQLESALSQYRARELYAATDPSPAGVRKALVREPGGTVEQLRGVAQAFSSLPAAVFVGAIEQPPAVLLSASEDSGIHAGRMLKEVLGAVGGRGGGSATLAQGTLADQTQLDRVVASLLGRE